jgi:hypothetical protein
VLVHGTVTLVLKRMRILVLFVLKKRENVMSIERGLLDQGTIKVMLGLS